MAHAITLSDGTTTLDLLGATYSVRYSSLKLGPVKDDRREIRCLVQVRGSSADTLIQAVQDLEQMLDTARLRSDPYLRGVGGDYVALSIQLNAATSSTTWDVLSGTLSPPDDWSGSSLLAWDLDEVALTLTCKPYGRGTETAPWNYLSNGSFEGEYASGVAPRWTGGQDANTGGSAWSTSTVSTYTKFGPTAQSIVINVGGTATGYVYVYQDSAAGTFAAGETAVCTAYISVAGLSAGVGGMVYLAAYTAANALIATSTAAVVSSGSKQLATATYANLPANTDHVRVYAGLVVNVAGGTGSVWIDGVMLERAASASGYFVDGLNHDFAWGPVTFATDEGDVPSDRLSLSIENNTANAYGTVYVGVADARTVAAYDLRPPVIVDIDQAGTGVTRTVDATCYGGAYLGWNALTTTELDFGYSAPRPLSTRPRRYRVFAMVYANAAYQMRLRISNFDAASASTQPLQDLQVKPDLSAWQLVSLGDITIPPAWGNERGDLTSANWYLWIGARAASGTVDFRIDYIELWPYDTMGSCATGGIVNSSNLIRRLTLDQLQGPLRCSVGRADAAFKLVYATAKDWAGGGPFRLAPGVNEIYVHPRRNSGSDAFKGDTYDLRVRYTPLYAWLKAD